MIRRGLLAAVLVLAAMSGAGQGHAQDAARQGVVQSPILTVEPERLFAESAFGRRLTQSLEQEGAAIAAENRRFEAELTAEEKSLTEQRAELPPDDFRALADAFDAKVQELRKEQDTKARALGTRSEEQRRQFFAKVEPVLGRIMQEAGAAVVLDKRTVFLAVGVIDITDAAIARIDAEIGDGNALMPRSGEGEAARPPADDSSAPSTLSTGTTAPDGPESTGGSALPLGTPVPESD